MTTQRQRTRLDIGFNLALVAGIAGVALLDGVGLIAPQTVLASGAWYLAGVVVAVAALEGVRWLRRRR